MRRLLVCLLGLYLGPWACADPAAPVILGRVGVQPLAGHLMVLETPHGASFAEVREAYAKGRFRTLPGDYVGGYRLQEVWLAFELVQPAPGPVSWLEVTPVSLEEIHLFLPQMEGGYREFLGGAALPFSVRPLQHRASAFPIGGSGAVQLPPVATCFLRVHSRTPLVVQPVLRTTEAFSLHLEFDSLFFGALFGTGILVMLWNLLYWFKLRDSLQLKYAAYLASMLTMLAGLEGYLGLLFLPERPDLVTLVSRLGVSTQPWLSISLVSTLFGLQEVLPRFDKAARRVARGVTLVALGFTLTGHYFAIAAPLNATLLGSTVLILGLALGLVLRGRREAWLYVLAFGPVLVGGIAHLGRNMDLLKVGFLGEHGLHLGAFFHFCLMNLPLAQRHSRLQRERDQAMARALELSERNERELEGRVEERTREVCAEQAKTAQALARERQSTLEQREFISMVSHEFRTPLAVIDGAAQVVSLAARNSPEEVETQADAIRRGARRLVDLLNSWLTRERIASGLTATNPERVELEPFLREVLQPAAEQSPAHQLSLHLETLPPAHSFDRELVRAALRNLVENAIKYSPQGGPVRIQASQCGGDLCLSVVDQGLGIPADQLEQVTTRFFRGRNTENIPGVGLGLHMVQLVAELHGGRLELESQEGVGTSATLILPVGH